MPFIVVNGPPVAEVERKRRIASGITGVIVREYGLPPESVTVLIREDAGTNVAQAGVLLSDRKKENV
jgi:4-oxalocrotonate tautomerase family enzyme